MFKIHFLFFISVPVGTEDFVTVQSFFHKETKTKIMRLTLYCVLIVVSFSTYAQQQDLSIFDGRSWGVVLQHPDMNKVDVKTNVTYLSDSKGTLKLDVYLPP